MRKKRKIEVRTPNIDNITQTINNFLKLTLNKKTQTHSIIIQGRIGTGKTYLITKILEKRFGKERLKNIIKGGHQTPLTYYCSLYDNPEGIFYWNDLNKAFFHNETVISLLKQSMDTRMERQIDYGSTTGKLENREKSFIFKGIQIFDLNFYPKNTEFGSILSRTPPIRFNPTNKEIISMMYDIIKGNYPDIPIEKKLEIVSFIGKNVSEATKRFDLRTLNWFMDVYRHCNGINAKFRSMVKVLLEVDETKELALICNVRTFKGKTGMSQRTYERYRQGMGLSRSYNSPIRQEKRKISKVVLQSPYYNIEKCLQ